MAKSRKQGQKRSRRATRSRKVSRRRPARKVSRSRASRKRHHPSSQRYAPSMGLATALGFKF